MTPELYLIKNLMIDCAELGSIRSLKELHPNSDDITQRMAYKAFGEAWIDARTSAKLLHPERRGTSKNSPLYYSRFEITALRIAENASRLGIFDGTRL